MAGRSGYEQFSPLLLEHFDHPQHTGRLNADDPNVLTVQVKTPAGDEQIQFQIHLDSTGYVDDVAWLAQASSTTLACCSWFSTWVIGKKCEEIQQFEAQELIVVLSLPKIRYNSAMLIDAVAKKIGKQQ